MSLGGWGVYLWLNKKILYGQNVGLSYSMNFNLEF